MAAPEAPLALAALLRMLADPATFAVLPAAAATVSHNKDHTDHVVRDAAVRRGPERAHGARHVLRLRTRLRCPVLTWRSRPWPQEAPRDLEPRSELRPDAVFIQRMLTVSGKDAANYSPHQRWRNAGS